MDKPSFQEKKSFECIDLGNNNDYDDSDNDEGSRIIVAMGGHVWLGKSR